MKTQPLLVVLAVFAASVALIVGSAIALKMTDTPISLVAGVASVLGGAVVALIGRSTVYSPAATEAMVVKAIETIPPATTDQARSQAEEMMR